MSLVEQLVHPVDEIFVFVRPFFAKEEFSDEAVRQVIVQHWMYGTLDVVSKGGKPIACARWNISASGMICDVLDLFIAKGENGFLIMKHIVARNWHRYPEVRFIRFARTRKYPGRKSRLFSIYRLLKVKES